MKNLLGTILVALAFCVPAFAQPQPQQTLPTFQVLSKLGSGGRVCVTNTNLTSRPYNDHSFIYTFPDGAPSAVTLTVYTSTDGTTPPVTSTATGTSTTGGTIHFTGARTNICVEGTSFTGVGPATIVYVGAFAQSLGSVTTDNSDVLAALTAGTAKNQICDAGGDCVTVTGSKLDVNATGTTDTDDGSVAGAQITGLALALGYQWNGSAWVRVLGNATDGLLVNLGANNDVTVTSGAIDATLAAETTKVIGTVRLASGGVASGSFASGAFASGAFASGSIASGAVASGAYASGAFASGAFASGSVASGAFASGSVADGAMVTIGTKADAKSTATDTTSITAMQVWKQISASVQAIAALAASDDCVGTIPSRKYYISVGSSEDESQVKGTAGTLCAISARNAHASANAFLKCTNLTAANTTPGSSTIFYEMMVPFGGGYVDNHIDLVFDTALTCYIVTGKAASDATEVTADDVSYVLRYR